MRNFLIDTDTASDDAVAIIMALADPDVRVLGLTTVAGNVGLEQATSNALLTAEICNSDVPVFMGADRPLITYSTDGAGGSSSTTARTRSGSCAATTPATRAPSECPHTTAGSRKERSTAAASRA